MIVFIWIIGAAIIALNILIIQLICKFMAKKNAEAFDYDRMAQAIADEFRYEEMAKRNGREIRNGINYDLLAKKIAEELKKSNET